MRELYRRIYQYKKHIPAGLFKQLYCNYNEDDHLILRMHIVNQCKNIFKKHMELE